MSLWVDTRAGSADLVRPMRAAGLPAEPAILPAGDVEVWGQGPEGRPLLVSVEYKQVPDMLACVRDGRFAEQLRRMKARCEVPWLLIEGEWRIGDGAVLEVRERGGWRARGHYTHQEVAAWLLTMAQRGGALLWRTRDQAESVAWLRALYWWWTSKEFEEHRAHLEWFQPPVTSEVPFEEPSLVERVAAVLPGVGVGRAKAAAGAFASVRAMVAADEAAWQAVDGVGPKTAKRVVDAVR